MHYAVEVMSFKTRNEKNWFYDVLSKVKDQNEFRQDDIERMAKLGVEFEPRHKGCSFDVFQQLIFSLTDVNPNGNPIINPNESQK